MGSRSGTGRAAPVQREIVALHFETLGRELIDALRAAVNRSDLFAACAMKVVVMVIVPARRRRMAHRFETRCLARQIDPHDVLLVVQGLELAVHRRQVDARRSLLRDPACTSPRNLSGFAPYRPNQY